MNAKSKESAPPWMDPDDAPEITEQWVAEADLHVGGQLVRRGRPVGSTQASVKQPTTLRLDEDTLARWRSSGKGWQTRAAELLAAHAPK